MFDQQLDIDGNLHDIGPSVETLKLFDSAPQIKGQISLEQDQDINAPELVAARKAMFQSFGWTR